MPPEDDGQQHTPDLAGYQSVDELARGYRASSDEGKRLKQRADQLEQQVRELQQTRQQVPQRNGYAGRLEDLGIPAEALDGFVQERFNDLFGTAFEQAFAPIARAGVARSTLSSSYPDYQKYETDVARWVGEDASRDRTYKEMFRADPEGAMEWAFLKYGQAKRIEHSSQGNGNGNPTPQQQARREAQIPSQRSGDARNLPTQGEEVTQKGWEHYQKTGDPRQFARARLRQAISDDFLSR